MLLRSKELTELHLFQSKDVEKQIKKSDFCKNKTLI